MAHSHAKFAAHRTATRRVAHILGHAKTAPHKKRGGSVDPARQPDLKGESAEAGDVYVEGTKNSHRIPKKRGGAIARPTKVNIVTVHAHSPHPMMGDAMPMQPGPAPPQGLPIAGQPAGPGPRLRPGPFKSGGHVGAFEDPPEDISNYKPARPHKAQGGKIKAGSASGVSRLEAFEMQKRGG